MSLIRSAMDQHVERMKKDMGDRTKTVGASEVGLCARRVWYAKKRNGDGSVVGSWGAYFRGTTMEEAFWYPALKARYGDQLRFAGPHQVNVRLGPLSATPDGFLTGLKRDALKHLGIKSIGSDCIQLECKTIDPRADLRKEKEEHFFQVQVGMGLVRDPKARWFFKDQEMKRPAMGTPGYALISYTDASFWDEVEEFPVKFDPEAYEAAKKRALTIFGATVPEDLKPEGWITGGNECEYCPFAGPCGVVRRRVPTGEPRSIDPQFVAEIQDLCREALVHKKAGEGESALYKDLQDQIKNRLREKGVRRIPEVVSWSPVSGRTTYDMDALRPILEEAGINLADFAKKGNDSDRLTIL